MGRKLSFTCVRVHFCHRFNHHDKVPCKPFPPNNKSSVTNTDPFHIDTKSRCCFFASSTMWRWVDGIGAWRLLPVLGDLMFELPPLLLLSASGTFFAFLFTWWNIDLCFSLLRPHALLFHMLLLVNVFFFDSSTCSTFFPLFLFRAEEGNQPAENDDEMEENLKPWRSWKTYICVVVGQCWCFRSEIPGYFTINRAMSKHPEAPHESAENRLTHHRPLWCSLKAVKRGGKNCFQFSIMKLRRGAAQKRHHKVT